MTNLVPISGDGPPLAIPENRVTLVELARALNMLRLESVFRDGVLFVVNGIDAVCSIELETEWTNVRIVSVLENRGPRSKVTEKINELNGEMIFARFHCFSDKAISADFFVSYEGDLNVRQLVSQLRRFAETVAAIGGFIFSRPLR